MTPQCLDLARRLAADGYKVFLPLFFGTVGAYELKTGELTEDTIHSLR